MEMMAVIAGLEALKQPCQVHVVSDSKYIIDAITKGWLEGWKRKGWVTSGKTPVKNIDMWKRMETAMEAHQITWEWVKGHAGHEMNERADQLAVDARENESALEIDVEFESAVLSEAINEG
jgi:ribonuclease HI